MAKSKSVDRQKIVTRLMKLLKKEFGGLPRRDALPVLETMIFAICLEDSTYEAAEEAYERLKNEFFDWNEVRVSTVTELEPIFEGLSEPHWRAQRIRHLLYYVFDHQYSWDFDGLKRKKLDLTAKQLSKIKYLTPFACHYLMMVSLGTHALAIDNRMVKAAVWTGILPNGCDEESGPELLKGFIKKADCLEFFWYLKSLSVSSKAGFLDDWTPPAEFEPVADISEAEERVGLILSGKAKRSAAAASRRSVPKPKAASSNKTDSSATKKAASSKSSASTVKKKTTSKAKKKTATKAKKKTSAATKKKTASKAQKKAATKTKKKTTSRAKKKR